MGTRTVPYDKMDDIAKLLIQGIVTLTAPIIYHHYAEWQKSLHYKKMNLV